MMPKANLCELLLKRAFFVYLGGVRVEVCYVQTFWCIFVFCYFVWVGSTCRGLSYSNLWCNSGPSQCEGKKSTCMSLSYSNLWCNSGPSQCEGSKSTCINLSYSNLWCNSGPSQCEGSKSTCINLSYSNLECILQFP